MNISPRSAGRLMPLVFLIRLVTFCAPSHAAEAQREPALEYGAWKIPISLFGESVSDGGKAPPNQPPTGFAPRGHSRQWDARDFLKTLGIPSIPGEEAIYDPETSSLIVKTSKENRAFIGSVLAEVGLEQPAWYLLAELSVYAYEPKSGGDSAVWPTAAEFFASGPNPPRLLDSLSGAIKSGKKARFLRRNSGESDQKTWESGTELLGKTAMGMAAEIESVVGPDEMLIDTNLTFAWRGQFARDLTADLRFTSLFTSLMNTPVIVQVSSLAKAPGTFLVVTANLRLETPAEWSLESLRAASEKVRAWQAGTSAPEATTP